MSKSLQLMKTRLRVCLYLLQVYGEVLHFTLQPLLHLLQTGSSGLSCLRRLLSLLEPCRKFFPAGGEVGGGKGGVTSQSASVC